MLNIQSNHALGKAPNPIAQGVEVIALDYTIALAAAPSLNDTIEMGRLPAGHIPLDFKVVSDDLDSNGAPALALSLGILNAGKTDLDTSAANGGAAWATGLTVGQTGTSVAMAAGSAALKVQAQEADRNIAFKVTTAAATFAAGNLRLIVLVKATP